MIHNTLFYWLVGISITWVLITVFFLFRYLNYRGDNEFFGIILASIILYGLTIGFAGWLVLAGSQQNNKTQHLVACDVISDNYGASVIENNKELLRFNKSCNFLEYSYLSKTNKVNLVYYTWQDLYGHANKSDLKLNF